MLKKGFLFILIFLLLWVPKALAHTGLESSTPQNGEVINRELQEVTLTFETKIEQGSKFELINANGNPVSIENIALNENQMVGRLSQALSNGDYQVIWNIIGADGHPIDGEFSFTVDTSVTEEPAEQQEKVQDDAPVEQKEETPNETTQSDVEGNIGETGNESTEDSMQGNTLPSYVIPAIIVVLIIIIIGSFLYIGKRTK